MIDWAEKFEDQLVDVRQWYDTNFADWLSLEGKAANQTSKALPQKKEGGITMYITFLLSMHCFIPGNFLKVP